MLVVGSFLFCGKSCAVFGMVDEERLTWENGASRVSGFFGQSGWGVASRTHA